MLIAFLLVLIYSDKVTLVLPHQYDTREACHAAAYGHKDEAERFACVQIKIDLADK